MTFACTEVKYVSSAMASSNVHFISVGSAKAIKSELLAVSIKILELASSVSSAKVHIATSSNAWAGVVDTVILIVSLPSKTSLSIIRHDENGGVISYVFKACMPNSNSE